MVLRGTLVWLCSLAVLTFSVAQETSPQNCDLPTDLFERLTADLQAVTECKGNLQAALDVQQTASLLLSIRNVTDALNQHQLRGCQGAEPRQCPEAEVPNNGGLVCITVDNKHYCKPLCNHGYDFGFMRRSRVYEECSEQTGYRWRTQYVGGNKLAVCNEAAFQISGVATAYFPKDQDCLTTLNNSKQQSSTIALFASELKEQGIQGQIEHECLVCGGL